LFTVPIIVALAAGVAITLLQFWLNAASAGTSARPHEVPIAVVGSRPGIQQLAAQLPQGDQFSVKPASNESAAIRMVNQRAADAIVNLDTRSIQTADAASIPTARALQQFASTHLGFRAIETKPLPTHDPNGIGMLFLALAFGLGGLPTGFIFAFLSGRRPVSLTHAGRWVLLVVIYSGVLAVTVTALALPLLGYSGSQFLTIWGWGALLTAAAMAIGLALEGLVGPAGLPLGLLVILLFGIPSSPVPVQPWNYASAPYRVLGPYDPVGAAVDGLRNGLFFAKAPLARNLLVLFGWIVIPMLAVLLLGWRNGGLSEACVEPDATTTLVASPI
jgi:hypothetical protein